MIDSSAMLWIIQISILAGSQHSGSTPPITLTQPLAANEVTGTRWHLSCLDESNPPTWSKSNKYSWVVESLDSKRIQPGSQNGIGRTGPSQRGILSDMIRSQLQPVQQAATCCDRQQHQTQRDRRTNHLAARSQLMTTLKAHFQFPLSSVWQIVPPVALGNLRLPVWDNVFEHVEWTEAGRLVVVVTWCSLFYCSLSEHSCHPRRKLRLLVLDLLLLWISNGNVWTSCDSEEEMDIRTGSELRSVWPGQESSFDDSRRWRSSSHTGWQDVDAHHGDAF